MQIQGWYTTNQRKCNNVSVNKHFILRNSYVSTISFNIFFYFSENCFYTSIPQEPKKREQWIENIQHHQDFTMIDQNTMRFSVCNQHFEANKLRRCKGRVVAEGPPTIFPKIIKVVCPSQQTTPTASILQMGKEKITGLSRSDSFEKTETIPLVEPHSCILQYRK